MKYSNLPGRRRIRRFTLWVLLFLAYSCTPSPRPSKGSEGKTASDAKATPGKRVQKTLVVEPVPGGVVDLKPPVFA